MIRVRWEADRQAPMFQKFPTLGLALQFAESLKARCNGRLIVRVRKGARLVLDYERPG